MSLNFRRNFVDGRIFAALSFLALFSLVSTVVTVISVGKMLDARQTGLMYNNARTALADTSMQINAAESSQRGYMLTGGDVTYLAPYTMATTVLPGDLQLLTKTFAGTGYSAWITDLKSTINTKLTEMEQTLDVFRSDGQAAAIDAVRTGAGQTAMSSITSTVSRIQKGLNNDVAASRVKVTHYANIARYVGLLGLLGTLVLVVGIYFLFDHAIEAERALDRAKDEFVSLASHQLRTPATGIKSILSMLEAGDFGALTPKQQDVVGKAVMSNERELAIIEELLNVAKADAGRLVLKPTDLNIVTLINQIVDEQSPAITAKQLRVDRKQPEHEVNLTADEEKLYMALSNLIDNARKYTPVGGHISINIGTNRHQVTIEVADSGIGIEEHELAHIFDRFQRARLVLAGSIEGTGLGLYLARRIAELHHGTISVESKKGHGSRFIMVIPRRTVT